MLPSDFNNNGAVDAADYVVWHNGLGTTYIASDYNTVALTLRPEGHGSAAGTGAMGEDGAVPEPGTAILLWAVGVMVSCARRRGGPTAFYP